MRKIIRKSLVLSAAVLLAACAPEQSASKQTSAALDAAAAEGTRYAMASLIGIGDIVIAPDAMITSDGQRLPIRQVGEGVWQFLEPPSKLTNGEDFCFSQPVNFFTWHRHDEGVWVMNVGDWASPPAVPDSATYPAEGGCGLSTYKAG